MSRGRNRNFIYIFATLIAITGVTVGMFNISHGYDILWGRFKQREPAVSPSDEPAAPFLTETKSEPGSEVEVDSWVNMQKKGGCLLAIWSDLYISNRRFC